MDRGPVPTTSDLGAATIGETLATTTRGPVELSLCSQYPEAEPELVAFLDTRKPAQRDGWAKELLSLCTNYGGIRMAQTCRDAVLATEPIQNAVGLRAFAARVKREEHTGAPDPVTGESAETREARLHLERLDREEAARDA